MGFSRPQERRRTRRIKIGQSLKVRPSDPRDETFEDTAVTRNVSRAGIYFQTTRKPYYEGMRLFVTLPYHFPRDPQDQEYIGQVTRVETLENGQRGIAVQLLSPLNPRASSLDSSVKHK